MRGGKVRVMGETVLGDNRISTEIWGNCRLVERAVLMCAGKRCFMISVLCALCRLIIQVKDIRLKCISFSFMESGMQVSKWGNSLAVRLPATLVEALELLEGDDIEIIVDDVRTFAVRKKSSSKALLAQLRSFRVKLPADFRFDRDDANARD